MTEVWSRRYIALFIALAGLRDLTPLVLWLFFAAGPQTMAERVEIASGGLLLALAAALWTGRAVRPALLASAPIVVSATALSYHAALVERGVEVTSRQALPMWGALAVFAVLAGYAVRWMWRLTPRAAP